MRVDIYFLELCVDVVFTRTIACVFLSSLMYCSVFIVASLCLRSTEALYKELLNASHVMLRTAATYCIYLYMLYALLF